MTGNFSQINVKYQTIDPGRSENTKHDKCRQTNKIPLSRYTIFTVQKRKKNKRKKEKPLEAGAEGGPLTYKRTKIRITTNFFSETIQTRRE